MTFLPEDLEDQMKFLLMALPASASTGTHIADKTF